MQCLRPAQAAARLGVSLATLWRYARQPDFPQPVRLSPRVTVFDAEALDRHVSTKREAAKAVA